jgi:hypothetical protein
MATGPINFAFSTSQNSSKTGAWQATIFSPSGVRLTTGSIPLADPHTVVNVLFHDMGGAGSGTVELGLYTCIFNTNASFGAPSLPNYTILDGGGCTVTTTSVNTHTSVYGRYMALGRSAGTTDITQQGSFSDPMAPWYILFYVAVPDLTP